MERPGERLKRAREKLTLTYRDVEQASQTIATRRGSEEFAIALSRLADIENKGTVPTIYRLYSLCAIYRLEMEEVLGWYGVPLEQLAADGMHVRLDETHAVHFAGEGQATVPRLPEFELNHTAFLSHLIRHWGKMPLRFLNGFNTRQHRYGFIGLEDWSMYPILQPGSLVVIDESRRKIVTGGWTNEYDRPIYFFEHRGGYLCGWATVAGGRLLVHPHPASQREPSIFQYPTDIEILGQVVAAATPLGSRKRRHVRTTTVPPRPATP